MYPYIPYSCIPCSCIPLSRCLYPRHRLTAVQFRTLATIGVAAACGLSVPASYPRYCTFPVPKDLTNSTKKSAKNDAPGFRALVLIGVAAAFRAAFLPHMTESSVASKLAEVNHPVAVPPQWLPVLLGQGPTFDKAPLPSPSPLAPPKKYKCQKACMKPCKKNAKNCKDNWKQNCRKACKLWRRLLGRPGLQEGSVCDPELLGTCGSTSNPPSGLTCVRSLATIFPPLPATCQRK